MNEIATPTPGLEDHKKLLTTQGEAAGKISGVNHIQLIVNDMDESVRFYRDILGFKVVRTMGRYENLGYAIALGMNEFPIMKNYFFDIGNGSYLTLAQLKEPSKPEKSVYVEGLWPDGGPAPEMPRKMDHLAFNVVDRKMLVWFRDRLIAHGVKCSKILEHEEVDDASSARFVRSVYFYDPSGNPLELATFDWDDPKWAEHKPEDWLNDPEPVPSLKP